MIHREPAFAGLAMEEDWRSDLDAWLNYGDSALIVAFLPRLAGLRTRPLSRSNRPRKAKSRLRQTRHDLILWGVALGRISALSP